jgi:hypothetical protein
MNRNLKDHGDSIEIEAQKVFNSKIRHYSKFWVKYVGNIKGKPEQVKDISSVLDKIRRQVAQWNYAILRNLLMLNQIQINCEKTKTQNVCQLLKHEIWFIASINLFYNNIEIFDRIRSTLKLPVQNESFSDFINMRNCIVHNIKPLIKIEHGYYMVPSNFDWFSTNPIAKNEVWIWSEDNFECLQYQRLSDFVKWCIENTFTHFTNLIKLELLYFSHSKSLSNVKEFEVMPSNNLNCSDFTNKT